jgi:hypothetical protein
MLIVGCWELDQQSHTVELTTAEFSFLQDLYKNLGVDMKYVKPTQLLRGWTQDVEGNPDFSDKDSALVQWFHLWYPFLLSKLVELCLCQAWSNWKLNCPLNYLLQFHIPLWPLQPWVITHLLQPELDTFCKEMAISTLLMICDGCPCQSASMQSRLE